jgi:hypothetical protein
MKTLRGGRPFRVTGASAKTGEDVEITVEAYDEADAARAANRQGVFVSACVAAVGDGTEWGGSPAAAVQAAAPTTTFAEVVARDPVVQRLVRAHPMLAPRVSRLNDEDRACLSALVDQQLGISYRDSAHVGKLMNRAER